LVGVETAFQYVVTLGAVHLIVTGQSPQLIREVISDQSVALL
jgi:hypothetical protein